MGCDHLGTEIDQRRETASACPTRCDRTYGAYVIFPIAYVNYSYVILLYVNRTLTSLYDENELASYLQPKLTKVRSGLNVLLILANANSNKKAVL